MDTDKALRLLMAVANGWATPEELQQLEAALVADPALRDLAAEWLCDESLLRNEAVYLDISRQGLGDPIDHVSTAQGNVERSTAARPAKGWRSRGARWISPVTIAALACLLLLSIWRQGVAPDAPEDPSALARATGSRLVRVTGCVWNASDGSPRPQLGAVLEGGQALRLIEGIAEFETDMPGVSGRVRLQGPSSAMLRSDGLPVLQAGRMVADLAVYADPFWLESPLGPIQIVDSGSIGIEASKETVAVHVLDGQIRLPVTRQPGDEQDDSSTDFIVLREGEAIRLRTGEVGSSAYERIAADPGVFAEEQSMATDQLSLGKGYPQLVLNSNPSGYWRFEEPLTDEALRDEVGGDLTLRVAGSVTQVRQRHNRVLEFGMTRESGHLVSEDLWPPEPLRSYTLEMWFKPSHFHNASLVTLVNPKRFGSREVNAVILELGGPHNLAAMHTQHNAIRFVNRSPALPSVDMGEKCSAEQYAIREWQHLVAVKDGADLRLHVNGEVVATATDDTLVPEAMRVVIGQFYVRRPERRFIGQLDELAIYKHALSNSQIARHFAAGRAGSRDAGSM